jgi:hypothetical protein
MNPTEIIATISSVGFPIVVAWYLLTKLKDTIDKNTEANNKISIVLAKICEHLNIPNDK